MSKNGSMNATTIAAKAEQMAPRSMDLIIAANVSTTPTIDTVSSVLSAPLVEGNLTVSAVTAAVERVAPVAVTIADGIQNVTAPDNPVTSSDNPVTNSDATAVF